MITPLINGITYAWANITVNILGRDIIGITEINYSDEQEINDIYGAGEMPVARTEGEYKAEASVTLRIEELIALQNAAPNKRIQSIREFDIIVKYRIEGSSIINTDIIKNCRFKKNSRGVKSGDKSIESNIPLATSHIVWSK